MRIITPGVPPNMEKEVTCKRCACKFAYTQDDVKQKQMVLITAVM